MQTVYKYNFRTDRHKKTVRKTYRLKARVTVWSGPATWYFAILPKPAAKEIKANYGFNAKGWGSLPVEVKAGPARWTTSIFPDKKSGSYVLPLKADVRKQAGIKKGGTLSFSLTIR